jgi:hypothetical protein
MLRAAFVALLVAALVGCSALLAWNTVQLVSYVLRLEASQNYMWYRQGP